MRDQARSTSTLPVTSSTSTSTTCAPNSVDAEIGEGEVPDHGARFGIERLAVEHQRVAADNGPARPEMRARDHLEEGDLPARRPHPDHAAGAQLEVLGAHSSIAAACLKSFP